MTKTGYGIEMLIGMGKGVSKAAKVIGGSYGPHGKYVVYTGTGRCLVSKDGLDIIRNISLPDHVENLGVRMVEPLAQEIHDHFRDGCSTAILLASGLLSGGVRALASGIHPSDLGKGIRYAHAKIIEQVEQRATRVPGGISEDSPLNPCFDLVGKQKGPDPVHYIDGIRPTYRESKKATHPRQGPGTPKAMGKRRDTAARRAISGTFRAQLQGNGAIENVTEKKKQEVWARHRGEKPVHGAGTVQAGLLLWSGLHGFLRHTTKNLSIGEQWGVDAYRKMLLAPFSALSKNSGEEALPLLYRLQGEISKKGKDEMGHPAPLTANDTAAVPVTMLRTILDTVVSKVLELLKTQMVLIR